jgi:hypothetical protein
MRLFSLERVLVARLAEVHTENPASTRRFADLIGRGGSVPESYSAILTQAHTYGAQVKNPGAFRPSIRDGRSLAARLWSVVNTHTPDQLQRPSEALADALAIPDMSGIQFHESIFSVISRPSQGDSNATVRFCRNVLVTTAASCRLITAAAHADEYGAYPLVLLRGLSADVRTSLDSAQWIIADLTKP